MDGIHSNWSEYEEVAMALELSDPGQPYSCASWGNQFNSSEPLIVHGGSPYYDWWGMFETTYVPAHAFIDHKMRLHYKTNTLGSYTANNNIEEMLVDCGECYVDGILMEEFGQQECCEIFGGTFSEVGDWDNFSCSGSDSDWLRLCGNPDGDNDGFNSDNDNCPNDYNPSQSDSDNDGIGDECDDCSNMSGDLNDDMVVDILDLVSVVNVILSGGSNGTECELADADMDSNGAVNILDVIQIINIVLGSARETVDGTVLISSSYDNFYVQHPIPRSDRQYSWYTSSLAPGSTDLRYYGYMPLKPSPAAGYYSGSDGKYVSFFNFVSASAVGDVQTKRAANKNFAQPTVGRLNLLTVDPVSGGTDNIIGFTPVLPWAGPTRGADDSLGPDSSYFNSGVAENRTRVQTRH